MTVKIRSVKYHLKQGAKSVLKNGLMSFASIASVSACAFILIISLCLAINLDSALEKIEESMGISLYLGEEVSDDESKELLKMLEKVPYVSNIDYMSKEDALNWVKEEWGDEQVILSGLEDDNPFPRSFELTISGAKYQKQVIADIEKIQNDFEKNLVEKRQKYEEKLKEVLESPVVANIIEEQSQNQTSTKTTENTSAQTTLTETTSTSESQSLTETTSTSESQSLTETEDTSIGSKGYEYIGIEKIKHSQKQSDILLATNNVIRVISIIIILILGIISITIIINTIKLTVFVRKNEINIMKYVGATDWFIRWPFVVEGIIIGLIGSLIPLLICMSFYNKVNELIYTNVPIVESYIQFRSAFEMFLIIAPSTLLLGSLLGIIGSVSSIKKHLNV